MDIINCPCRCPWYLLLAPMLSYHMNPLWTDDIIRTKIKLSEYFVRYALWDIDCFHGIYWWNKEIVPFLYMLLDNQRKCQYDVVVLHHSNAVCALVLILLQEAVLCQVVLWGQERCQFQKKTAIVHMSQNQRHDLLLGLSSNGVKNRPGYIYIGLSIFSVAYA